MASNQMKVYQLVGAVRLVRCDKHPCKPAARLIVTKKTVTPVCISCGVSHKSITGTKTIQRNGLIV